MAVTDPVNDGNAVAGPSNYQDRHVTGYREIPSYVATGGLIKVTITLPGGVEFFEYRRRLFLSNQPLPNASASQAATEPTCRIPLPLPDPIPSPPNAPAFHTSVGRLEALLSEDGAEETMAVWTGGLAMVHEKLTSGRKLSRPLKLGLVIKVLKAGWIKDGTWPIDPATSRAVRPPDSPFLGPIPPLRTSSLVPGHEPEAGEQAVVEAEPEDLVIGDGDSDGEGEAGQGLPTGESTRRNSVELPAAGLGDVDGRREAEAVRHNEAIVERIMDDERDVRIGDNLWRGAQDAGFAVSDGAVPTTGNA